MTKQTAKYWNKKIQTQIHK